MSPAGTIADHATPQQISEINSQLLTAARLENSIYLLLGQLVAKVDGQTASIAEIGQSVEALRTKLTEYAALPEQVRQLVSVVGELDTRVKGLEDDRSAKSNRAKGRLDPWLWFVGLLSVLGMLGGAVAGFYASVEAVTSHTADKR